MRWIQLSGSYVNQYEKANLWGHRKVERGSRQKQPEQSTSEKGPCFPATFFHSQESTLENVDLAGV